MRSTLPNSLLAKDFKQNEKIAESKNTSSFSLATLSDKYRMIADKYRIKSFVYRMPFDKYRIVSDFHRMKSDAHRIVSDFCRMLSVVSRMPSDKHRITPNLQILIPNSDNS